MPLPRWFPQPRLRNFLLAGLAGIAPLTLFFYLIVVDIETTFPLLDPQPPVDSMALAKPVVHIGVISRYPPTIMFRGYQPLMDYLTAATGYRFELLLGRDYNEALEYLVHRRAAAVFLGSYLYVRAHDLYGVVPLLKPLNENRQPFSRSALIVRTASPIRGPEDLVGARVVCPSAESFSALWFRDGLLPQNGLRREQVGSIRNLSHHHTVIAEVLNGSADAGVTRELLLRDYPEGALRIVALSDPIPSSPLAILPGHDTSAVRAMRDALLAVNKDDEERVHLTRGWDPEFVNGFIDASDADYAVVRKLVRDAEARKAAR